MADKSEWSPDLPLGVRSALHPGGKNNMTVSIHRYRDFANKTKELSEIFGSADIRIPWMMNASILREADKSDPNNQLRCYGVRIGEKLAFRLTFLDTVGTEEERDRMALMAFLLLGAEHGAEIRDAIVAAREESK